MKLYSWTFGVAVMAQVALFAPPSAFAQAQTSDQLSPPRQAIQWSQDRLSEFDAAITNLEQDLAKRQADARANGEAALKDLRAQRDAYRAKVNEAVSNAKTWTDTQASEARKSLDEASTAFHIKVGEYLDAVKADVAARRAVLQAEYEAGQKAWKRSIDELRSEARKLDAKQRADMDARIDALKGQIDDAKVRIERLQDVSREAWSAVTRDYAEAKQRAADTMNSIRRSIKEAVKT
jgi:ATP/maltotriose-dependent transcriptional regulator MalT